MSSRSLIPVLLFAAVVFACGPRAHGDSVAKRDSAQVTQAGAVRLASTARNTESRNAKGAIEAQLYVRATESSVRLALYVVNTGKKRVELTFPSGQTYDFTIVDSLGREVWRWGKGRMFTQTLRNKLLSGGESLEIEVTYEGALPAGRYIGRAMLTSRNFPLSEQAEFTIDRTTIAAR